MSSFKRVKRVELKYDLAVIWVGDPDRSDSNPRLREELNDLYETYEFQKLILNLEDLKYLDNEDISAMLLMLKQLGRKNVKLCCLIETVTQVFKVLNLEKVLTLSETLQEAIGQFE